jgi:hypothetical protein
MLRLPHIYPNGVPLYWGDEQSGTLRRVVTAYLEHADMRAEELALLAEYLAYVVEAPCWQGPADELAALRSEARRAVTVADVHRVIRHALDLGIDPL